MLDGLLAVTVAVETDSMLDGLLAVPVAVETDSMLDGLLAVPVAVETDSMLAVPLLSEITLVAVMVLRYVELVGQLVMSGGHAVAVMTLVRVIVDSDTGEEDEFVDGLEVMPAPERGEVELPTLDSVEAGTTGPVSVSNIESELVGRVEVAIDVVG